MAFKFTIGKKIFLSFFLIIFIFGIMIVAGYSNLRTVSNLTAKVVPYNMQMLNLLGFFEALTQYEKAVDQYLVVFNYENQEKAEAACSLMDKSIADLTSADDPTTRDKAAELGTIVNGMRADMNYLASVDRTKAQDAGVVNARIVSIYEQIDNARQIHKALLDQTKNQVRDNTLQQQSILQTVINQFAMIGALALVLSAGLSILLTKTIAGPIKKINNAAQQVADGKIEVQIPQVKTNDEIQDLAVTMELVLGAIRFLKQSSMEKAETVKSEKEAPKEKTVPVKTKK